MVTVDNLRTTKKGVICDRRTSLGNVFLMKREKDRSSVCLGYSIYFNYVVKGLEPEIALTTVLNECKAELNGIKTIKTPTRRDFMAQLNSIKSDDVLLCWCKPKDCHCDTIANYLNLEYSIKKSLLKD